MSSLKGDVLSIVNIGFIFPYESKYVGFISSLVSKLELLVKQELLSQSISFFGPQNSSFAVPFQYKYSFIAITKGSAFGVLRMILYFIVEFTEFITFCVNA